MEGMALRDCSRRDCRYKIAWVMPPISRGSGGINTILRNAEALVARGCQCDFFFPACQDLSLTEQSVRESFIAWYGYSFPCGVEVNTREIDCSYDAAIATFWTTAQFVASQSIANKIYFVQDWEPWFYPMGYEYIVAANSYALDLQVITIGRWLAEKCDRYCEKRQRARNTDFCADLSIYRDLGTEKERAICAIFQPEKPRRATKLLLDALSICKKLNPDLVVYLYGSEGQGCPDDFVNLGLLSTRECNDLYNRCLCGISISLSNPSRIPFEMMAAGLPVVEIYGEQTLYDLPGEACLLSRPDAASLATAINRLLDDSSLRESMAFEGLKFMLGRSIEREGSAFSRACLDIIEGGGELPGRRVKMIAGRAVEPGEREERLLREMNASSLEALRASCEPLVLSGRSLFVSLRCPERLSGVKLALWSKGGQEDLTWIELVKGEEVDSWSASFDVENDIGAGRVYHFHFYVAEEPGKERFLLGLDKPVVVGGCAWGGDGSSTPFSVALNGCEVSLASVQARESKEDGRMGKLSRLFRRRVR